MSDLEDLLARTLRDSARALPAPADPLPAIRARAGRQRRNAALGVVAVALVVAATLAVPAAVTRLTRAAPTATATTTPELLEWAARGPLSGDAALVREAIQRWRDAPRDRPGGKLRLVWAGRVGPARTVVLQAVTKDGVSSLAEVGDVDGALTLRRVEPITDPGVSALRLDAAGAKSTHLLVRPGAATVSVLDGSGQRAVPAGGLVSVEGDLAGQPVVVLDKAGRILGDGTVPAAGRMSVTCGTVRFAEPSWPGYAGSEPGLRVDAAGPGQRPTRTTTKTDNGVVMDLGPYFPTGPGTITLVDRRGRALSPIELPAYRP